MELWKVDPISSDRNAPITISDHNDNFVARTYGTDRARLIAAAPELLEACRQALDLLDKCPTVTLEGIPYNSTIWRVQLRAAIAKSEGK